MSEYVLCGVVCDRCDRGLIRSIYFLDGTTFDYCTVCDFKSLKQPYTYVIERKEKFGCVLERTYTRDFGDGPFHLRDTKTLRCYNNFDCNNCGYIKEGYTFKKFAYKKITKGIRVEDAKTLLKEGKEVLHEHNRFKLHPITRKHKKKEGSFQNYEEWIKSGKPKHQEA